MIGEDAPFFLRHDLGWGRGGGRGPILDRRTEQ